MTSITQNTATLTAIIDSITPLLDIGVNDENHCILWLDFLLEIQAKLMQMNEYYPEEGFAFRCVENFRALRQTLGIFASNKINPEQLQELKNGL